MAIDEKQSTQESITIAGRGDLHLGVILEKMRREGFEMSVTPPSVLTKVDDKGNILEPYETVYIDTDLDHVSNIVENLNNRKGVMLNAEEQADGRQLLTFRIPSRGLLGFRTYLTAETRGTAQFRQQYLEHDEWAGSVKKNDRGAIISTGAGNTTGYALKDVQEKGPLFVGLNTPVYQGMVVGEHILDTDMEMNCCKAKELNNIRSKGKEEGITLTPPRKIGLEDAVTYIREDELVEVTPNWIRIRKKILDSGARARMKRQEKNEKANKKRQ
jgi:GTP-binding protein